MKPRNRFLLFISACIPGCGQMYQGYMKRGVSLLTAFSVIIAVSTLLYIGQLALFLPVLWLYAFFDTFNLRRALEQDGGEPDAYLFGLSSMDQEQLSRLLGKRHSLIGWLLIAFGAWLLWQEAVDFLLNFLDSMGLGSALWDGIQHLLLYQIPHLIVILLVIALGLWFIRWPKAKPDDSFTSFVPPAPEEAPDKTASDGTASDGTASDGTASDGTASDGTAPGSAPAYQSVLNAVEQGIRKEDTIDEASKEVSQDGE